MGERTAEADHTAVRVALWRAPHLRADPPPHVIEDEAGLRLADPSEDWRQITDPAREAGFREVRHVTAERLGERYFAGRRDGLRPSRGEEPLVATV
ncbi:hypothetical protein [Streptomyces collinus]|uniref:hypothetical protein n=1 Tax=Streptomyces collinus TaxID=42684 RepID=UPI00397EF17C